MANEIIKLGGNGINREFLFLYPVAPPITYTGQGSQTKTVSPTPSSGLSVLASDMLTVAQKNDLESGDLGFEVVTLRLNDADMANDGVLIPALQSEYTVKKTNFLSMISRTYSRAGENFNGVV